MSNEAMKVILGTTDSKDGRRRRKGRKEARNERWKEGMNDGMKEGRKEGEQQHFFTWGMASLHFFETNVKPAST